LYLFLQFGGIQSCTAIKKKEKTKEKKLCHCDTTLMNGMVLPLLL